MKDAHYEWMCLCVCVSVSLISNGHGVASLKFWARFRSTTASQHSAEFTNTDIKSSSEAWCFFKAGPQMLRNCSVQHFLFLFPFWSCSNIMSNYLHVLFLTATFVNYVTNCTIQLKEETWSRYKGMNDDVKAFLWLMRRTRTSLHKSVHTACLFCCLFFFCAKVVSARHLRISFFFM